MKLSNKILIGFFGFVLLYMLLAFTEVRFRGDYKGWNKSNSKVESTPIDTVKYLVLKGLDQQVKLSTSDQPRIELKSRSGAVLSKLEYETHGDTLVLERFALEEHERVHLFVYVTPNDLAEIKVNKSSVVISNLDQLSLSITQSGGSVNMEGNNKLGNMRIDASEKANFRAAGFSLDTLSVQLDHADIKFWSKVERLEGGMINQSHLLVKDPGDIQFKKDESSRLRVVN
ncbi:hypothetical protein FNH22_09280 [Fulvivirga sp. M361]|uniref:GIN domain-containing protein n=1 Tax=Fulvivirga sp. M361 TaxID=2594266 RepID=UPI00117BC2DF|nr:DUF2807 domain-containing protein [Fulvivirga sp. M361]TRX60229.1 hypothetical protein FNH22_09280 [Fulvivirga sp. M361]